MALQYISQSFEKDESIITFRSVQSSDQTNRKLIIIKEGAIEFGIFFEQLVREILIVMRDLFVKKKKKKKKKLSKLLPFHSRYNSHWTFPNFN